MKDEGMRDEKEMTSLVLDFSSYISSCIHPSSFVPHPCLSAVLSTSHHRATAHPFTGFVGSIDFALG